MAVGTQSALIFCTCLSSYFLQCSSHACSILKLIQHNAQKIMHSRIIKNEKTRYLWKTGQILLKFQGKVRMHHLRTRFLPLFPIPMSKLSHYWRIHPTVYATNLHFCPRDRWASDQVVSWQGLLFIPQYTKMTQHFSTIFPFSDLTFSILQLAKNLHQSATSQYT